MTPADEGRLLLDTNALIWLAGGQLAAGPLDRIGRAASRDALLVSAVSGWEIGLLQRKAARASLPTPFSPDPQTWFERLVRRAGLREQPLTAAAAMASSMLPGELHGDPADRLLIATARHLGATLMTRDRAILDYAEAGHVRAVAC